MSKIKAYQAYKLFVHLEGLEMMGRKFFNFWVMVGIFVLTLISVSFSHAGLDYLSYKMEDPFINWVDIVNQGRSFDQLKTDINNPINQKRFKYSLTEENHNLLHMFLSENNKEIRFEGRTIDANSSLLDKILCKENMIEPTYSEGKRLLHANDYGLIITQEMAVKLGYNVGYPVFIKMLFPSDKNSGYYRIPLPVISVVKQLPDMMSFMSTSFFYSQRKSNSTPFDLSKPEYNDRLKYYFPIESPEVEWLIKTEVSKQLNGFSPEYASGDLTENCWLPGKQIVVTFDQIDDTSLIKRIDETIQSKYKSKGVVRIYDYSFSNEIVETQPDYLSVHFNSLDSIRQFQQYLKNLFEVKVDMSQIDSKENFSFVNKMGITLSIGFVVMSCVFIFTFIFYLLRTHFLKIKRNLGTFKAFGVSNQELTSIYLTIMLVFTTCSFLVSFVFTLILERLLVFFQFKIESGFSYLNVFSLWTVGIFILAILSSMLATYFVTRSLLSATPGDLIYDRDI